MIPTMVVLAGGLGTRLRPAVKDVPKPLAPVAGRPFLEYLIAQGRRSGCGDVVLCVDDRADLVRRHFGDGSAFGVTIRYSVERERLGTAGALRLALDLLPAEFLVFNGDSYCVFDARALEARHRARGGSVTIVVAEVDERSAFGSVELDPRDRIVRFVEKGAARGRGYVNAGVYLLSRSVIEAIPSGRPVSIEREIFPSLADLHAFRSSGPFVDIGTPESYAAAQAVLPSLP